MADEFVRYEYDMPKFDEEGRVVLDVNGNIVYLHYKGDVVHGANGEPVRRSNTPQQAHGSLTSLESHTESELVDLEERLQLEKAARIGKVGIYRKES